MSDPNLGDPARWTNYRLHEPQRGRDPWRSAKKEFSFITAVTKAMVTVKNAVGRPRTPAPARTLNGSHQPSVIHDNTEPSPKNLVMAVMAVKSAVNHFAKTLISDMKKYPELKHLKQRIRHEVQGDVDRANHWKFLVQAFVCQRMFEGFDTKNGFFGIEHFDGQKMSTFISFADFTTYKDTAATISELFARDSEDRSFLGRYCFKKLKAICVDPVTNLSLAIYEQDWSRVKTERHPQSEFYRSFLKVAVSIWLLHRLVHSFEQGWRMLGWATFPKGCKFQRKNMESALPGGYGEADQEADSDGNSVVGFLVIPGFEVSKSVVKCEVYLRNTNNLTDNKLIGGSEARLREFWALSYLKDAEVSMKAVKKMIALLTFNKMQSAYLHDKLCVVIESANSFLKLSRSIPVETTSSNVSTDFVEIFELLMGLGKQTESFVEGCCRDDWIQAAMVRTNVSEYVSSLGLNLDLCKVALGEDRAASGCLTLDEVDSMNKSEVELVKRKASVDAKRLIEKVVFALNSLNGEHRDLASYLLQRLLEIGPNPSSANETLLSDLFAWVEAGDQVGRGASAIIYKAMWLGTRVAKKTFRGSENVEFVKEVQILSRLCHPNITSMFCYGKNERNCSIIMELMDGDLNQLMDRRCEDSSDSPPFPILEAVDIMLQIGEGVNYLHSQGIVHRDLKSKNILYMNVKVKNAEIGYVQVKVADFGISKARDTNTTYSELTCNIGTNRWMPPEIIRFRDENVGLRSNAELLPKYPFKLDSYSFGLVCYEILVGHEPFWECNNPNEVKRRILSKERPPLPCKSSECPVMLKALIEKCWSHEPKERPTFAEICRELTYIKYLLMAGGAGKGKQKPKNQKGPASMGALLGGDRGRGSGVRIRNSAGSRPPSSGCSSRPSSTNGGIVGGSWATSDSRPSNSGGWTNVSPNRRPQAGPSFSNQEEAFPPVSAARPPSANRRGATDGSSGSTRAKDTSDVVQKLTIEEFRTANKALKKSVKTGLRGNEQAFADFRDVSARYRNGEMNILDYYKHIIRLGLSSVVPELGRLCPDPVKGKELIDAHAAQLAREHWTCEVCTLANRGDSPECVACGSKLVVVAAN